MDSEVLELVKRLIRQTKSGAVQWEDASTLSGGERFRLNFGDAVVEVTDGADSSFNEDGVETPHPFYRIEILNNRGFVLAEKQVYVDDPEQPPMSDLFQAARSSARNTSAVIGSLLQRLGPATER